MDYSLAINQNKAQLMYMKNLLKRRNSFSNQAFLEPISKYIAHNDKNLTPILLWRHGLRPLYALAQIMKDSKAKFDEIEVPDYDELEASDHVIQAYEDTLAEIEPLLQDVDTDGFVGELAAINGKTDVFTTRLGILTMHAVAHIAQAIYLQGLISEQLALQS